MTQPEPFKKAEALKWSTGLGTDVWAMFCGCVAGDVAAALPPTNYPWALEFHLQDPDRHVLRFGSDPKENQPYSEWVAWYLEGERNKTTPGP